LYDAGMVEAFDFAGWYAKLEARHLVELTFPEVRRALQALSSLYVERRNRIGRGTAFDGRGKRAAFALFYGPLHYLTVREIVRALGADAPPPARVVDLGCGTGTAGAAWALEAGGRSAILGVDASRFAVEEAAWTYRSLGLAGVARRMDLLDAEPGASGEAVVAAYAANEMDQPRRKQLLGLLLKAHARGSRVLVVEPIARRPVPWWDSWRDAFSAAGGRADLWRFKVPFPERLKLLDRAAGLDHRELTARSLFLP
jgi:SAM-dependent methyltransferase